MGHVLVCMGPFEYIAPGRERTYFEVSIGALVPEDRLKRRAVSLENKRMYAVFKCRDGYYVVYDADNLDFYAPFLAPLPACKMLDELAVPKCPLCGSYNVRMEDDEWRCRGCGKEITPIYEAVWRPRPFDPTQVKQGAGILRSSDIPVSNERRVPEKYIDDIEVLERRSVKLGNFDAEHVVVVGYLPTSEEGHGVAVYEKYIIPSVGLTVAGFVRDLSRDELVALFPRLLSKGKGHHVLDVLKKLPVEDAAALVKKYNYAEKLPLPFLEKLAERDASLTGALVNKIIAEFESGLQNRMLSLAQEMVDKLRRLDPGNPFIAEAEQRLAEAKKREAEEAEQFRRDIEKTLSKVREEKKLEDIKRKLEDELRGLPVEVKIIGDKVEVRLTKYVPREVFDRYVSTCKKHGLRFSGKSGTWVCTA